MFSLLSTENMSAEGIRRLLDSAQVFKQSGAKPRRQEGTVALVFCEPSTRTKLSFQQAAYRLGLNVLDFSPETSSIKKGESLLDTLQTIEAIGADLAVIRTGEDWPRLGLQERVGMGLINAGSGINDHPTQALLDALTIQEHFPRFSGITVTIVGDVAHSRVARSNLEVLTKLGAQVQFAGPEYFWAPDLAARGRWVSMDEALATSDVLMMLRIQLERHQRDIKIDSEEYHRLYGLDRDRLRRLKKNAIVLHPGPVNRGVEISSEVMEDPCCCILQQVKNGVYLRMAVLEACLEGGRHEQLVSA